VPPDLRRRLARLESDMPRAPEPYVVEVPPALLSGPAEELDAWLSVQDITGPVALVPPTLNTDAWKARYGAGDR
jgi:hypothetical protein